MVKVFQIQSTLSERILKYLMKKYISKPYILRYIFVSLALFINGLNITLTRISCLGSDPFSSLNYAINSFTGIPMGTAMMFMNVILFIFCILFLRSSIGYGMVACTFILGNAADFWNKVLTSIIWHPITFSGNDHMLIRVLLLIFSMIMNIFFCSFYIAGDVGMSPYDALGYVIEKLCNHKIPFKFTRIITDILCVICAFVLAKPAHIQWQILGIGTFFMALCTGPILDFFLVHISRPFYTKLCKENF